MRLPLTLALLAALAAVVLLPSSTARSSPPTEFTIEVDRVEGIDDLQGLDDADVMRAVAVAEQVKGDPLPGLKALALALKKEFGSVEIFDGGPLYIWEIDPETGELIKICIERDRVLVTPDQDSNPIVVSLVTRVLLD